MLMKSLCYILILAFCLGLFLSTLLVWGSIQITIGYLVNLTASTNQILFNDTQTKNNASQTSWNETFTTTQNRSFYITFPQNITSFQNAFFNLKGYVTDNSSIDDIGSGQSCYGNVTCGNCNDQNWNPGPIPIATYCIEPYNENFTVWENYTVPSPVNFSSANLTVMFLTTYQGAYLRGYCWDYSSSSWSQVYSRMTGTGDWYTEKYVIPSNCYSNSPLRWKTECNVTDNYNFCQYDESKVTWVNTSYPQNVYLGIGDNIIINKSLSTSGTGTDSSSPNDGVTFIGKQVGHKSVTNVSITLYNIRDIIVNVSIDGQFVGSHDFAGANPSSYTYTNNSIYNLTNNNITMNQTRNGANPSIEMRTGLNDFNYSGGLYNYYKVQENFTGINQWQGDFDTTKQITDISYDLTDFLSSCSADMNGNCNVTFLLHNDKNSTPTTIEVSGINTSYNFNYNITPLFTSQFSSDTKILNQNYTHRTIVNYTSLNSQNNLTVAGLYLNISGSNPVSCTINGSSGTVDTSLKTCNYTISVSSGNKFGNYTLAYDKGIIFQPLTAINWTQDTDSTTTVNGTTYIKGKASGNNSDSVAYSNVQYDNSVATQEARDSTWTCNYPTATDLNLPANGIGNASSYGIFCTKSSMIYVMEGTGWVQDTSFTTEAGNWTYIKGKYRANNSDTSVNYTNVYFDTSLNNTAVRSGWNGYISATGYLNISAGQTNNSSSFNIYANKTGMITKIDAGDEILDSAFNSIKFANSSGWNWNTSWYYWISNISLNNTDEVVNYSNVYWQNRLAGADFNYSGNISNGTASTVNFNSLMNVETRYRTKVVNAAENIPQQSSTNYEKDVNLYIPSDLDASFKTYYTSIYVNVTLNSSYENFDLFWWDGYVWEKKTNIPSYQFSVDANRNWAVFYAPTMASSIEYYSVSSSTPITAPPSPTSSSVFTPTVVIGATNFTIEQPEFNLFGSLGGQLMTWITIKNLFSRVATPEFTCINGNYTIDFCKNVWFGEMEITQGKPQFRVYEIPAGTTSRIPMFIILPEEEGTWTDAFVIKVKMENQEQLATATVSVSPFWGIVGQGISWFQGSTVINIFSMVIRVPNSFIVLISAIVIIILIVIILRELKKYGRKR